MIGVTRENVNRALAALALDGVLRQDGGRYILVDEERLRRDIAQGMPIVARRDRRTIPLRLDKGGTPPAGAAG